MHLKLQVITKNGQQMSKNKNLECQTISSKYSQKLPKNVKEYTKNAIKNQPKIDKLSKNERKKGNPKTLKIILILIVNVWLMIDLGHWV